MEHLFPKVQINGEHLRGMLEAILERRATPHFLPDPIPETYLEAVLKLAAHAPSGYNFQPWRFIVVRNEQQKERLKAAAYNQEKIVEAPVVVIAFGLKEGWKDHADEILLEGSKRGMGKKENVPKVKEGAFNFLSHLSMEVWLNRHVMIAFTTLMYAAEAYGIDTAPMEGFDAEQVKKEFKLPEDAEVIALLAMGRAKGADKPYGGRLPLEQIISMEEYGTPWHRDK